MDKDTAVALLDRALAADVDALPAIILELRDERATAETSEKEVLTNLRDYTDRIEKVLSAAIAALDALRDIMSDMEVDIDAAADFAVDLSGYDKAIDLAEQVIEGR